MFYIRRWSEEELMGGIRTSLFGTDKDRESTGRSVHTFVYDRSWRLGTSDNRPRACDSELEELPRLRHGVAFVIGTRTVSSACEVSRSVPTIHRFLYHLFLDCSTLLTLGNARGIRNLAIL